MMERLPERYGDRCGEECLITREEAEKRWRLEMAISKKTREAVYAKYDRRCVYRDREIAYKDMQVDHFKLQRAWSAEDAGTDDISNLMPSCRMCNHYKRANSLETFRRYIAEISRKLRENYICKIGVVYGNVVENEMPIEFYFEKMEVRKDETSRVQVQRFEEYAFACEPLRKRWKTQL